MSSNSIAAAIQPSAPILSESDPLFSERTVVRRDEKPFLAAVLAVAFHLAAVLGTRAQSYSIDWFTIAGGSGSSTSTGGVFSIGGTVGQPAANAQPLTGGTFALTGGFWSLFAMQTPGAPLLSIAREGANVRVFWPLSATGFVLDQSLTATGVWSQVSFPYATNETGISVSAPTPTENKFYRLRKL